MKTEVPTPDSDRVKLVREFEKTQAEVERLRDLVKECSSNIDAARINYEMSLKYNQEKISNAEFALRVEDTRLRNYRDMLGKVLELRGYNVDVGCYAEAPLSKY